MSNQPSHTSPTASDAPSLVRLENIVFSYPAQAPGQPPHTVLSGACLDLRSNSRIGLLGLNGSGKTTLLRCLTGLNTPQAGAIFFHDRQVTTEKQFRALRMAVGSVLQNADDQLFFPTVLEDVAFGPLNLGMSADEALERANTTLHDVGLDGFADRLTHRLSGGEKKLVTLAGVLAMHPEALLLDEPTGGLDAHARERLIDILGHHPAARLVISHDWDFLSRVTDSWLILENGTIQPAGPAQQHTHTHIHPCGGSPHKHTR